MGETRKYVLALAIVVVLVCCGRDAIAYGIGMTINTNGSIGTDSGTWALGWDFTVDNQTTLTEIGLYDHSQDGFVSTHAVGLYDNTGLLTSSTGITGVQSTENFFHWVDVTDVTLKVGTTYTVVASNYSSTGDNYMYNPTVTWDSNINYIRDVWSDTSALVHANVSSNGQYLGWFGPNIRTSDDLQPVPEPTTIALLGIGLIGLVGAEARRRRKKKAVDNS